MTKASKYHSVTILLLLTMLLLVTGCGLGNQTSPHEASGTPAATQSPKPSTTPPKEQVMKVSLAAVGDVLIHSSIFKDAKTKDGYNFQPMFDPVKSFIEQADIAMANQESMIGGEQLGLSDFPRFNGPYEVGDALKATGFDIVNLANNHTLDRGEAAITNTIQHFRKLGIAYTGAYLSVEDQQEIRVMQKNGISFAFLSYTYGTNGLPVPKGKPYLVNLIDIPTVTADITKARKLAEVVVVNVHFGQEYVNMPNTSQKKFTQAAAEAGADIIIGHHPHVLQPIEWITTSSGRKTFVAYSLGNFIAAQEGDLKRTGGIVQLEVQKTVRGNESQIQLINPSFIPTWIKMTNWRQYQIVPLWEAPANQLANAKASYEKTKLHMSQWMPELQFPMK
ncbi:Capsule biosynthesis protein CapA [compost metagenome]